MKKDTSKKIKQLRHKSIWGPIISMIMSFVFGFVFVLVLLAVIITSIVENRYFEACRQAYTVQQNLNLRIENGEETDEILSDIQKGMNAPLAINVYDKNGKIKEAFGDKLSDDISQLNFDKFQINLKLKSGKSGVISIGGQVRADSSNSGQSVNTILVDLPQIADNIFSGMKAMTASNNERSMYTYEVYRFAYWINMDLDKADENVCIKYEQPIYLNDCIFAFVLAIIAAIVLVISVIGRFFQAIGEIIKQKSLLKLILEDPVTGGNNMLAFEQVAEKELRRRKKNAYAIVDFSLLKYQNFCTLYGMQEGENLICRLQTALSKNICRGECVAKISGSDFVLLLKSNGEPDYRVALLNRVNRLFEDIPSQLKTAKAGTGSLQGLSNILLKVGIYVIDPALDEAGRIKRKEQSANISQLYMKAGIAKQALAEDSGVMLYNHEMWEKELWEQKVEDTMQAALDNCEFQVYIQPKYHPSTEELKGGEALVRWISPTEGFISPGQFIPIFEKNGFITRLDDYMILNTARLQAYWLSQGKKIVPISVNVSRIHFSQPDLAEHIRDLVDRYSLPRHFIEIELTESAFFDDKKMLLATVHKLQEYGFEVSMDDFGAGYSSLNSLKDLPLDVLKLDAEFFRGDDFDSRGEVVVSEAISLAKQLNMKIVAEGIEKKEQVDFLARLNCDMIQGYYFAKPMPASEYESRMTAEQTMTTIPAEG